MRNSLLIVLAFGFLVGCATEKTRKPVGPQGSTDEYMPWNTPQAGEGQGAFGGMFDQR